MNKQITSPNFLTVEELATMLRVKKRTVYEWVSREKIPFRKAGDRTLFLLDEIMEWTVPFNEGKRSPIINKKVSYTNHDGCNSERKTHHGS
jgi:excisionase family DNA binding protein